MDEKQKEILFRLSLSEQKIQQLQQQLQAIEEGKLDLNSILFGLDDIENSIQNNQKEILANIGRGVFVKAKLISSDIIVDVGNKILVKKSSFETKKLIEEQLEKIEEMRKILENQILESENEINDLIRNVQKIEED